MEILANPPLMTIFLVVALGAILGAIPLGPLRLGAAGALFVGLIVGNLTPELSQDMAVVQQLGLALFVYCVGLSAGQTFFADLRRQYKLMICAALALSLSALVAVVGSLLLGVEIELGVGVFAGSLTTTPALAAATAITGTDIPAVGYSLGYPAGVIVGILVVALIVGRSWPGKHDTQSLAGQRLRAVTAVVAKEINVRQVPGWKEQLIKMSYVRSGNQTRVLAPGETLKEGDQVVVVGMPPAVETAVAAIGHCLPEHLADDRSSVDFRPFLVSRNRLSGKTVAELNLASRFGAVVTRLNRGDLEMLADDDTIIEVGDRLYVAFPRGEGRQLAEFFGNSRNSIAEFDAIALGLGIVLGILLGMIQLNLPGGASFQLGSACGPLVVGMILGYINRTGPLVWQLPSGANLTIRQLGLLLFMAAVGIASGPAFAQTAFTATGLRAGILGVAIPLVALGAVALSGRLLGLSAPRTSGAMAGTLGQPALLAFASSKINDERIEAGYVAIFAFGIVTKILLVSVIMAF